MGTASSRTLDSLGGWRKLLIGLALVGTALIILPLFGHVAIVVLVTIVAVAGAWELTRAMYSNTTLTQITVAGATIGSVMIGIFWDPTKGPWVPIITAYLGLQKWYIVQTDRSASDFEYLLALAWLGGSLASALLISENYGASELLILATLVYAGDAGAQICGKLLKRRFPQKLVPMLSPNKTWVGFCGGYVLCLIFAGLLHALGWYAETWNQALLVALIVNTAGVCGDLYASSIKRTYDVKDFSRLLSDHGGVLDRVDSLLLAAPMYWLVMQI